MDIQGNLAYLSIREQQNSGLASPIDINDLDLHAVRSAADAAVDKLEERSTRDTDELTHQERATLPVSLEGARARSGIYRAIAMEKARRAGAEDTIAGAAAFLRTITTDGTSTE